jgi:hypothetical protein
LGGTVSRQIVAIAIMVVPIVFAGKFLDALGSDSTTLTSVVLVFVGAGAVGGAIYHPIRRFWWRGALAGVLIVCGSFAVCRAYQTVRPNPFGHEFAVVALVGSVPGIVAYYFLMRHQRVTEDVSATTSARLPHDA